MCSMGLNNWEVPSWGKCDIGRGPVPPSLEPLIAGGMSLSYFDLVINDLLGIYDHGTPPALKVGGALRPAIHVVFATMIMYYVERREEKLAVNVTRSIERAVHAIPLVGYVTLDVVQRLTFWSTKIKEKFDRDNLHLTTRQSDDGWKQVFTTPYRAADRIGPPPPPPS